MTSLATAAAIVLVWALGQTGEATLTGKWQGETGSGASIALDLTATGTALTGTLTRDGQSSKLSDGKITGNTFTFKATLSDKDEAFSGERKGDELHVWLDRQGPAKAVVFKPVKSKPPQP